MSRLMTVREVAAALALCDEQVRRLARRGDLQSRKYNRLFRFDPAEVMRFMRERIGFVTPGVTADDLESVKVALADRAES